MSADREFVEHLDVFIRHLELAVYEAERILDSELTHQFRGASLHELVDESVDYGRHDFALPIWRARLA